MADIQHALSVRSDFSLGESTLKIKDIVSRAVELGYKSVALVDTMTVSSMITMSKEASKQGIKPIVGCRLRVVDEPTDRTKPKDRKNNPNYEFYPKVYVLNEQGLKDLFAALTKANSEEQYFYVPRLGHDDLMELLAAGNVAVSTGDIYSVFHHPDYARIIDRMVASAGASKCFVELVAVNTPLYDTLNMRALDTAQNRQLPTLATRPVLYATVEDADARDILSTIVSNHKIKDPWRHVPYMRDLYFQALPEFMQEVKAAKGRYQQDDHGLWRQGVENIGALADLVEYEWKKQPVTLPKLVDDEYGELVRLVKEGWKERLTKPTLGYQPDPSILPQYKDRLAFELQTLKEMGFENYFLVVRDLVMWSKSNNVRVGPGRGSVGGSLIAYLLHITDVDPLRFGLIFERFINPERLDLPDADLDFMSSRRHEVIEYLTDTYGTEQVAGISNYGTLGSASAMRDAARVYELNPLDYTCSKLVPSVHGKSHSLEEAAEEVPEIDAYRQKYPEQWAHSVKLQGVMRSLGRHAAGIVVAGEPIANRGVVERRKGEPTVNWDKRVVEEQGLIKMDILGLSTLDVLEIAREMIQKNHRIDVDYLSIDLDDKEVLEAFARGETTAVFQFESPGMKGLLRDLAKEQPLTFEEISAATALYRPGPMDSGLMDDYVSIRQGLNRVHYEHPNMEEALRETEGVIVYQEQVMRLARDLAGFTMAGADHLRKAMGKKDPEMMAKQREKWVEGCKSHSGMSENAASLLFDKIEAFAGYAFNKSHSVEYSIISFWAMWLKVRYPAEFYAASMSIAKEERLPQLVKDAQEHNIFVVPPDINKSGEYFEIGYDAQRQQNVLITPFGRIKGVSNNSANAIFAAREKKGGPFTSKDDFLEHVNKTKCNKRIQANLDAVGAFAEIENQTPARHPDRLKDQMQLMPGLIVESIKADRKIDSGKFTKAKVIQLVQETRQCENCSLKGSVHPTPKMGSKPKFMVVTDHPNFSEEKDGQMMSGVASDYMKAALKEHGLSVKDGYFTSLVKAPKSEKQLTNEQINGCKDYLMREIEILKPPVIFAAGGNAIRTLVPGIKGGFAELCGQVHFMADYDASVVFGINPQMIYMDPGKQEMLNEAMGKVAEMVSE